MAPIKTFSYAYLSVLRASFWLLTDYLRNDSYVAFGDSLDNKWACVSLQATDRRLTWNNNMSHIYYALLIQLML
jgi:hypothetical protein